PTAVGGRSMWEPSRPGGRRTGIGIERDHTNPFGGTAMSYRTAAGLLLGGVLAVGATLGHSAQPTPEDAAKAKKALQEVQDFIGVWNLEGVQKSAGKTEAWKEKVSWSWKFKGDDAWMVAEFAEGKGKYYSRGE